MSRRIIEGEPDYEAALQEFLKLAWAKDGLGPYAEELKPEVLPNGVTVPVISTFDKAQRIVDAALVGRILSGPTPDMIERAAKHLMRRWVEDSLNPDDPDDVYYPQMWDEMEPEDRQWYFDFAEAALVAALWGDE